MSCGQRCFSLNSPKSEAGAAGEGDDIKSGEIKFCNALPLVLIAGPCALESRAHALEVSDAIGGIMRSRGVSWVYKSSFDKANRTSLRGERGLGLSAAIEVFGELGARGISTITDVHEAWQCAELRTVVSMLQIPAFLCRQTDLLVAAARTGLLINVKKGQFLAPWDMDYVAAKLTDSGAAGVLLCERGTSFGYNRLVVDMAGVWQMVQSGYPVIMDATHSVQLPGTGGGKTSGGSSGGGSSGGNREYIPALVRAACALGVAGLFIETHPDPDKAPSDGKNMLHISDLASILDLALEFDVLAKRELPTGVLANG